MRRGPIPFFPNLEEIMMLEVPTVMTYEYIHVPLDKKYIERLEQVIRVLKELKPEKKFGIHTWMTCGTKACACGWAGSDPWFMERGFKTRRRDGVAEYNIFYDIHEGREAAQVFFGISRVDFSHLFLSAWYDADVTKEDVISRIERFITEDGAMS